MTVTALKRVVANTVEKRLSNGRGRPNFNVVYCIVNTRGDYAAVSLYESEEKPLQYGGKPDVG